MSRIGKLPITIANGVTVNLKEGQVEVSGPKGTLTIAVSPAVKIAQADGKLTFTISNKLDNALWGTTRANVANAILGVSTGWQRNLEMVGVGFKSAVKGKNLEISAGFSHPVSFPIPEGITIAVEANTKIAVSGVDKGLVGQTAAKIRKIRKPEPYKGKGIKFAEEVIRRKAGKSGKAGAK